jgi:acetoin:2,6-dichlorophenolindophenol oxidoreductase subunit alpha
VPAADVAAADERAAQLVTGAVDAAKAAEVADPGEAMTDVWADGGAAWRT